MKALLHSSFTPNLSEVASQKTEIILMPFFFFLNLITIEMITMLCHHRGEVNIGICLTSLSLHTLLPKVYVTKLDNRKFSRFFSAAQ